MVNQPERSMEEVIRTDGRYPPEAFGFLHDGLAWAVRDTFGEDVPEAGQRHVTGSQLCLGMRDLAIDRWGRLARTVLERWNIRATVDFGKMVYLLIEHDFMKKTEEDSLDDFRDVYEFSEAFNVTSEFELKE